MKTKHDVQPNTPEWLDLRAKYRTASEAAIVLGISPFTTPENFKLIKAGIKKQYYSKAMQLGHEKEEQIRQWCNDQFGLNFKEEVWTNGDLLASLDGIDGEVLVEIKTSDRTYNDLIENNAPAYYVVQVQQQLHCSPAKVGYIVAYSPKEDKYAVSEPITYNPAVIEQIYDAWAEFDVMPLPEGDLDVSDTGWLVELFKTYELLKAEADATKARMDKVKEQLVEYSKSADRGLVAGGYKLTVSKPRTTYDYKAACKGMDLEPFKKVGSPTYTLTVPKPPFEADE